MSSHLAHQFFTAHRDYFFQEAHYLVEASAVHQTKEISPNIFLFGDGSFLIIQTASELVQTYSDESALKKHCPDLVY